MVQKETSLTTPYRDLGFNSQHPHGSLELSSTLVAGNPIPFSDFQGYQICTKCTDTDAGKTPIRIK